jgi:hypothetical protein
MVAGVVEHEEHPPTRGLLAQQSFEEALESRGVEDRAHHAYELAVAQTDGAKEGWFVFAFVRKEAVLSSQIEGTQATLVDLLEYEAEQTTAVAGEDIKEVCNYLDAIKYARGQIKTARGLPISMRLMNEAHRRLMRGVRGENKQPGEIRRSQNWVGGTRPAMPYLFLRRRRS